MWQKIVVGILVMAAIWYLVRRIYRNAVKGDNACADCPPAGLKNPSQK